MSELQPLQLTAFLSISQWRCQRRLKLNMRHTKPVVFLSINLVQTLPTNSTITQVVNAIQNPKTQPWQLALPHRVVLCQGFLSPSIFLHLYHFHHQTEVLITSILDYKNILLTKLFALTLAALQPILHPVTTGSFPHHKLKIFIYLKSFP